MCARVRTIERKRISRRGGASIVHCVYKQGERGAVDDDDRVDNDDDDASLYRSVGAFDLWECE